MKLLIYLMAALVPLSAQADTLSVRITIGDMVFAPVGEISLRKNLRTMSTPPYTLIIPSADIEAFSRFTLGAVGQRMEIIVCDQVALSAVVQVEITNPYISIHNAPKGGLLDQFFENGCP